MKRDISRIREAQLVAAGFLQLDPGLRIRSSDSDLFELLIELPIDGARFAVLTCPSREVDNKSYQDLKSLVNRHLDELNGCPLVLAYYDELNGLYEDLLLSWDWDEPVFNRSVLFKPLGNWNASVFFTTIRKQVYEIRFLEDGIKMVVKKIRFIQTRYGISRDAEIVYLRDFSPVYKMVSKPVKDDPIERFNRNLNGQPQDEYPEDLLDKMILDAIRKVYPDASVVNSMLITNTEFRRLLNYLRNNRSRASISIIPDFSILPHDYLQQLGQTDGISISLDIFERLSSGKGAFSNEYFKLLLPVGEWFESLNPVIHSLPSLHLVSELIHFPKSEGD